MTPFVEVHALNKRFGAVEAVRDLSFFVRKGEVLGLLGPNGAGKTTTMKIVTGFIPATSGEVRICGHDIARAPIEAKRRIGYLPEGSPLYGDMTPASLLAFTAALRGIDGGGRRRRIGEVVEALELGPVLPRRIDTLSKGFRRRVGLAQAILSSPDVLILDEPTDGLDPNQKFHVRNLIRTLGGDKAIVISTHLLEEVDAVCDRVVIIDAGRIVLEGTPAELHARARDARAAVLRVRAADAERASAILAALPGAHAVRTEASFAGTALLAGDADGAGAWLAKAGTALVEAGIDVLELKSREGSLDQVFRDVTGGGGGAAARAN